MPTLQAKNLRLEYPTRTTPLVVLQDVSLELDKGQALAVLGPSGSGKSSLLHLLGGLAMPTSGSLTIDGHDPATIAESDLARFRSESVGFIFQEHHLLPQCSALENVLVPTLTRSAKDRKPLTERAKALLTKVGLGERLDHRPAELSGGERQRVAVCRALILQPPVVLADEPTGSLDRQTAETIGDLLLNLCKEENAILICVTHSNELAKRFPKRSELQDGKLNPVK